MTKNRASLKPSEVLGTNWLRKLRTDLFVRTEFIVISIFFLLAITNLIIIAVSLHFLSLDIASVVIRTLSDAILTTPDFLLHSTTTANYVLEGVETASASNIIMVVSASLIATIIFGYVATRLALAPAKYGLSAQKKFISNIAHELRTPLSIIRANSEILLLQKNMRPDTTDLIESNVEELDRVSVIINNLLTLNTFRHVSVMNFELVNFSEVVKESITKLAKLASSHEITLEAGVSDELVLWGNKNALGQIAMNLIKNAILFTPKQGSIFVSAYATTAFMCLEVRDTGIGIEAADIGKVFEPFYQVEPSRTQNKGSGGLGLAIVSELVKFHHGKISVRSTPGVGTLIKVDFPFKHPDVPKDLVFPNKGANNEVTLDFSKR